MKNKNNINDFFELKDGLEIDIDEGWSKITNRQFGGDPARGFAELIQNLIDSYDSSVPMTERKGIIKTRSNSISITDFGSGFTKERLKLILTLGGTDKSGDSSKIGMFGIGFFAIFNEALHTTEVIVTTKCEGYTTQIKYLVQAKGKVPKIVPRILDEEIEYSTKIEVKFSDSKSVLACLRHAEKCLEYYPCQIEINNRVFDSIWVKAKNMNWETFDYPNCNGIIKPSFGSANIKVLSKYEQIINLSLNNLLSGASMPKYSLDDYDRFSFPYTGRSDVIVNCDRLSLTISRDSFYLNYSYEAMVSSLKEEFFHQLSGINLNVNPDITLANLFLLREDIAYFIGHGTTGSGWSVSRSKVIKTLAAVKVFNLSGHSKKYSILDLKNKLSPEMPLFYSIRKNNIRWLGGQFQHDFVLLPERCRAENGAINFYFKLLKSVFGDIVNLDAIQGNSQVIKKLVERGIVSQKALEPKVEFVGRNRLSGKENEMLESINRILQNDEIHRAIEDHLYLRIKSIQAVFFEIKKEGAYISTGIFDNNFGAINDEYVSNFQMKKDSNPSAGNFKTDLLLGLRKDHPLLNQLMESEDKFKPYYAITYIAHELTASQKLLSPYSTFYNWTKEKLAAHMRRALINDLTDKVA